MRTVLIPPGFLRPAPQELAGIACALCENLRSKWELTQTKDGDTIFLCSPCVLYTSPFSKLPSLRENLASLVSGIEASMRRALSKDARGWLQGEDADRVVYAIVVVSNSANLGRRES